MFFPAKEFPSAALESGLAEVGVVCRPLPDLDLPPSNATDTVTDLSGFTMKVAALLLSRFQEVTLLYFVMGCHTLRTGFRWCRFLLSISYSADNLYVLSWNLVCLANVVKDLSM